MTPEEHEAYIAKLEREANESMDEWERDKRTRDIICAIFIVSIAVGLLCYFLKFPPNH